MSQPSPVSVAPASRGRTAAVGAQIFLVAVAIGLLLLTLVQESIHFLWVDSAANLSGPRMWLLVVGITGLAGALVAVVRSRGADGHNPMGGIAMVPVKAKDYPSLLAAILATLLGGLVLGPEVALVVTGAFVGTELGKRGGLAVTHAMPIGVLGAVLALFLRPLLSGSSVIVPSYTFAPIDIVGAVAVAAATAGALFLARTLAVAVIRLRGGDIPRVLPMAVIGATIGVIAAVYREVTGDPLAIILTSGEGMIDPLLGLGTASAVLMATGIKWLVYSLSLGGGFRGGPYFPALFVGAGIGGWASMAFPEISAGAAAAGIAAAFAYLYHGSWKVIIVIGALIGAYFGGWQAIIICVVAALVAKALPAVQVTTGATGDVAETLQR